MKQGLFLGMLLAATLAAGLAACSPTAKTIPCPLCYEDEWSREPFPGQPKQHIKPLTPEDIKANHGMIPTEFLGEVSTTSPGDPERW